MIRRFPVLVSICIACILGAIVITWIVPDQKTNFEEFALGPGTASFFAHHDGYPIHINNLDHASVDSLIAGWHLRGDHPVIFMVGNSQTHGINQYKPGQQNFSGILFDSLSNKGYEILAQSVPNANLQEFLYLFQFWKQRLKITTLVVPVFFDDMREDGIRFAPQNKDSTGILLSETSEAAVAWNSEVQKDEARSGQNADNAALAHTVQEKVEVQLSSWLSEVSETWRERPQIRGELFTSLYLVRNQLLGIKAQSIRKLIPSLYEKNFNALELLVEQAEHAHIRVLLYIPPIRSDIKIPYDEDQYAAFKQRVENLADQHDLVTLDNMESLVPGQFWGVKESTTMGSDMEYDFMHFSFEGHKVLAHALQTEIMAHHQ